MPLSDSPCALGERNMSLSDFSCAPGEWDVLSGVRTSLVFDQAPTKNSATRWMGFCVADRPMRWTRRCAR